MIQAGGWQLAFVVLAAVVAGILALVLALLPEGHPPDPGISLRPGPILAEYWAILRHPRFPTYAGAGAFSFAGLFTFVAGSPAQFMDGFGLGGRAYSLVFALLAGGFIAARRANVAPLRRFSSETLFARFLAGQVAFGVLFLAESWAGVLGLGGTIAMMMGFLTCVGVTNPNASALALGPFTKNAGSASALLGFFQLGAGAVISTGVSAATQADRLPIVAIFAVTAAIGLVVLLAGRRRALAGPVAEEPAAVGPVISADRERPSRTAECAPRRA